MVCLAARVGQQGGGKLDCVPFSVTALVDVVYEYVKNGTMPHPAIPKTRDNLKAVYLRP